VNNVVSCSEAASAIKHNVCGLCFHSAPALVHILVTFPICMICFIVLSIPGALVSSVEHLYGAIFECTACVRQSVSVCFVVGAFFVCCAIP